MPTPTYDLIASNVLGSSASSVTFSSIPATYRDLVFVADCQGLESSFDKLTFNISTGSNHFTVAMAGNGSAASSSTFLDQNYLTSTNSGGDPIRSDARALVIFQIMDYAQTDKHKTVLGRASSPSTVVSAMAGRVASTTAITSLTYASGTGFISGSSFYLYGIVS